MWRQSQYPSRPKIHYTEWKDLPPDHVFHHEWNTFRRELPRLLAEGLEGQWVLIKGDEVIGVFLTFTAATEEGSRRFLLAPYLVQEIVEYHRVLRVPYPVPVV
jgi:hypothetical protein